MPEFISILRWIRDIVYPKAVELENKISNLPDTLTGGYSQNYIDNIVKDLTKNVKTIDDLLLEDGLVHKTLIVEDINRGGTFVSKTVIEIDPNTGNLYSINDGTVFAKLGGGFWVRQYSGSVNVKWFGASNLASDNRIYIQNAISYSRIINIPDEVFLISGFIEVDSNKIIYGNGEIKVQGTGVDSQVFKLIGSNITIKDIVITADSKDIPIVTTVYDNSAITGNGTASSRLKNIIINNCKINGFAGYGININLGLNISILNNSIKNIGYAGISLLSCLDSKIIGNEVDNVDGSVVNFYGITVSRYEGNILTNPKSTNIIISHNIIKNIPRWTGIDAHSPKNVIISNNRVYFCRNGITSQYDSISEGNNAEDILIENNMVEGNIDTTTSSIGIGSIGLSTKTNKNIVIVNNIINAFGTHADVYGALFISNSENIKAEGNIINKSIKVAISVTGTTKDCFIKSNIIDGIKAGSYSALPIYIDSANLTNIVFDSNIVKNQYDAAYTPSYCFYYTGIGSKQIKLIKNRILAISGGNHIYGVTNGANKFLELNIEKETEVAIIPSKTTVGGATIEVIGTATFDRNPTTNGDWALMTTFEGWFLANPTQVFNYGVKGGQGNIFTAAIYKNDGTNVPAGIVTGTVGYRLTGIFWN